jgi:HEAT repeat protein
MEANSQNSTPQDSAAVEVLLAQLKEKLYIGDMSKARRAAHNLSWMQEAGFEILKNALLDKSSIGTKISAAYGLRSMRGRMKKMALEVLLEGLKSPNANTRRVCTKTALMMTAKSKPKSKPSPKPAVSAR